jgi:hypothetical protein
LRMTSLACAGELIQDFSCAYEKTILMHGAHPCIVCIH